MFIIRKILGAFILFLDWVFTPKGIKRHPDAQALITDECQSLTLYEYKACPFCVKVRRAMKRLSLPVQTVDAKRNENTREELIQGGGRLKVPCLKISEKQGQIQWLYESSEIISYLEKRFSEAPFTTGETQASQ